MEVVFSSCGGSLFSIVYDNPDVKRAWERYMEVTDEERARCTKEMKTHQHNYPKKSRKVRRDHPTNPEECYNQLHAVQKEVISRFAGDPIVGELESTIVDFLLSKRESLTIQNQDLSQRFIIYCICSYYSLCTNALEEVEEDKFPRTLMVYKYKFTALPEMRLSQYLMQSK